MLYHCYFLSVFCSLLCYSYWFYVFVICFMFLLFFCMFCFLFFVFCVFVVLCFVFPGVCSCLFSIYEQVYGPLPPGGNPIAVNIISYSSGKMPFCVTLDSVAIMMVTWWFVRHRIFHQQILNFRLSAFQPVFLLYMIREIINGFA